MPLYPAPDRDDISGTAPNPDSATARAGFGALWDFATSLLGLTGDPADARAALEVPFIDDVNDALALMPTTVEMNDAIADAVAYVAGDVLQMVTATDAGATLTTNTLTNVMGTAASITPKSTASKLYITATFNARLKDTGNREAQFAIYEGGSQLSLNSVALANAKTSVGGPQTFGPMTIAAITTNSALTARSFTIRVRNPWNTDDVGATSIVMAITEIKT